MKRIRHFHKLSLGKSMCFLQCHDDKLERYLTKRKQYFAKQKRYTSNCRNVVIEKSKNQNEKTK